MTQFFSLETATKTSFNSGWRFIKTAVDAPRPNLWESGWQSLTLPHDWLIYDTHNLYQSSTGWYHKTFSLEDSTPEDIFYLYFDGVYMDSTLFINDKEVGQWKYGYTAFYFDITPYLTQGDNEIIMKVVHQTPNSRWYSGAGIYRNVWLYQSRQAALIPDGTYLTTQQKKEGQWALEISSEYTALTSGEYTLAHSVYDDQKRAVATTHQKVSIEALQSKKNTQEIMMNEVQLWDIENPYRYRVVTTLLQEDRVLSTEENPLGFRTVELSTTQGFLLNGRRVPLQGSCEHHDLGALGSATNTVALQRQLSILQDMGVNAIRTAHNPPSKELMHLADCMGFLIVSEAFDQWKSPKNTYDYARFFPQWHEKDVASWVRRDRNHPSLIFWSLGNEILDTHLGEEGRQTTQKLSQLVASHDPTRKNAVTFGSNHIAWENTQKAGDTLKLVGYNYSERLYEEHRKRYPDWYIYGSETASILQSRGIYHFPLEQPILAEEDLQCSSLGNSATSWGAKSVEQSLLAHGSPDYVMGQFIWTGFDYIGEPTPYRTKNSYFGQIDTAGFPKDFFYVYQSQWTDYHTNPMVHILPYWDFSPGQTIDVRVCSNAPEVELFLNNESLGSFSFDDNPTTIMAHWKISYAPGELRAVARDQKGTVLATTHRRSFTDSTALVLTPSKSALESFDDMVFFDISTVDKDGNPVENANHRVSVKVEGPAQLLGLDNGNSADFESYKTNCRRLFSGKLLAMVGQATNREPITISVTSPGLAGASYTLNEKQTECLKLPTAPLETEDYLPVRNIKLQAETTTLTPDNPMLSVKAELLPKEASETNLVWSVRDATGLETPLASLEAKEEKAVITALGDGTVYLRCGIHNGEQHIDLYSSLDLHIKGIGDIHQNPYGYIEGMRYEQSNLTMGIGINNGVAVQPGKSAYLAYQALDFGPIGSHTMTFQAIPDGAQEFTIELWDGMPYATGSKKLYSALQVYPKGTRGYREYEVRLPQSLSGVMTLGVAFDKVAHFQGFQFTSPLALGKKIAAKSYQQIYGDSFLETDQGIMDIGNNVSLTFPTLSFGEKGATQLTLCGQTPDTVTSVQVRFLDEDSHERIETLVFDGTKKPSTQIFPIDRILGSQQITLILLPGAQFDFYWFKLS